MTAEINTSITFSNNDEFVVNPWSNNNEETASFLANDFFLYLFFLSSGDDHYPADIDYDQLPLDRKDKTVHELREGAHILHRLEVTKSESKLIIENYTATNHVTP